MEPGQALHWVQIIALAGGTSARFWEGFALIGKYLFIEERELF